MTGGGGGGAAKTILSLPMVEVEELSLPDTEAKIGRVWMNRPEARNALNFQIMEDIEAAFFFLQKQYHIPVVIFGGKGKSFSAGADLKGVPWELPSSASAGRRIPGRERRHMAQVGRRVIAAIENLEAITIARVHGHAAGGGFGLMHACDMKVCTHDARLWLPEVDLQIPLTWGLTARLIRDVGRSRAMELITLCDDIKPEDAKRLGVVNRVVADERELEGVVLDWAARLARKNESTLHLVKTQFRALNRNIDIGDATETDNDFLLYSRMLDAQAKL